MKLIERMNDFPVAELPELANEQHYELPAEFFNTVLGAHNKYIVRCGKGVWLI